MSATLTGSVIYCELCDFAPCYCAKQRNALATEFRGLTALTVRVTSNRLGSRGWRLSDTVHGRAVKSTTRNATPKRERSKVTTRKANAPIDTTRLARELALQDRKEAFARSLPSIHVA